MANINPQEHEMLFEEVLAGYFKDKFKKKKRRTGFHCSSAGSCARAIAYNLQEYEPTNTPNLQQELRWLVGHYVEKILDEAFKKSKILTSTNMKITDSIDIPEGSEPLSGELDQTIIINLKTIKKYKIDMSKFSDEFRALVEQGLEYVVDIKTAGLSAWGYIPKNENMMQLNIYMHETGIHHGLLLYINPDTGKYRAVYVPYSQTVVEGIFNKYKFILKHKCQKTLPDREAPKGNNNFPCAWVTKNAIGCCEFFTECWKQDPPNGDKQPK